MASTEGVAVGKTLDKSMEAFNTSGDDDRLNTSGPIRKKRRVRGVRLKRQRGDVSFTRTGMRMNKATGLNSTIVRQTLRTNNRALAKALETARYDLNAVQQQNLDLQHTNQNLLIELNTLKRVAGLRNEEIDKEVESRTQTHLRAMKGVIHEATVKLLAAVDALGRASEMCSFRNSSSIGYRTSCSLGIPLEAKVSNKRQSSCRVPESGASSAVEPEISPNMPKEQEHEEGIQDTANAQTEYIKSSGHNIPFHEMSIIMEQSVLDDTLAPYNESKSGQNSLEIVPEHIEMGSVSNRSKDRRFSGQITPLFRASFGDCKSKTTDQNPVLAQYQPQRVLRVAEEDRSTAGSQEPSVDPRDNKEHNDQGSTTETFYVDVQEFLAAQNETDMMQSLRTSVDVKTTGGKIVESSEQQVRVEGTEAGNTVSCTPGKKLAKHSGAVKGDLGDKSKSANADEISRPGSRSQNRDRNLPVVSSRRTRSRSRKIIIKDDDNDDVGNTVNNSKDIRQESATQHAELNLVSSEPASRVSLPRTRSKSRTRRGTFVLGQTDDTNTEASTGPSLKAAQCSSGDQEDAGAGGDGEKVEDHLEKSEQIKANRRGTYFVSEAIKLGTSPEKADRRGTYFLSAGAKADRRETFQIPPALPDTKPNTRRDTFVMSQDDLNIQKNDVTNQHLPANTECDRMPAQQQLADISSYETVDMEFTEVVSGDTFECGIPVQCRPGSTTDNKSNTALAGEKSKSEAVKEKSKSMIPSTRGLRDKLKSLKKGSKLKSENERDNSNKDIHDCGSSTDGISAWREGQSTSQTSKYGDKISEVQQENPVIESVDETEVATNNKNGHHDQTYCLAKDDQEYEASKKDDDVEAQTHSGEQNKRQGKVSGSSKIGSEETCKNTISGQNKEIVRCKKKTEPVSEESESPVVKVCRKKQKAKQLRQIETDSEDDGNLEVPRRARSRRKEATQMVQNTDAELNSDLYCEKLAEKKQSNITGRKSCRSAVSMAEQPYHEVASSDLDNCIMKTDQMKQEQKSEENATEQPDGGDLEHIQKNTEENASQKDKITSYENDGNVVTEPKNAGERSDRVVKPDKYTALKNNVSDGENTGQQICEEDFLSDVDKPVRRERKCAAIKDGKIKEVVVSETEDTDTSSDEVKKNAVKEKIKQKTKGSHGVDTNNKSGHHDQTYCLGKDDQKYEASKKDDDVEAQTHSDEQNKRQGKVSSSSKTGSEETCKNTISGQNKEILRCKKRTEPVSEESESPVVRVCRKKQKAKQLRQIETDSEDEGNLEVPRRARSRRKEATHMVQNTDAELNSDLYYEKLAEKKQSNITGRKGCRSAVSMAEQFYHEVTFSDLDNSIMKTYQVKQERKSEENATEQLDGGDLEHIQKNTEENALQKDKITSYENDGNVVPEPKDAEEHNDRVVKPDKFTASTNNVSDGENTGQQICEEDFLSDVDKPVRRGRKCAALAAEKITEVLVSETEDADTSSDQIKENAVKEKIKQKTTGLHGGKKLKQGRKSARSATEKLKNLCGEIESDGESDSSVQSCDSEKMKRNFKAWIGKPGKITFTAGRRDLESQGLTKKSVQRSRSKGHSILPKKEQVRSRSKSAQKALKLAKHSPEGPKSVFDFSGTPSGTKQISTAGPQAVYDISLNESAQVGPSTFNQFVGRQNVSKPFAEYHIPADKMYKYKEKAPGEEDEMVDSPHGIMLVLGNGKRTKPRRARSKTVCISQRTETHDITVVGTPKDGTPVSGNAGSENIGRMVTEEAGSTPVHQHSAVSVQKDAVNSPTEEEQQLTTEDNETPCIKAPSQKSRHRSPRIAELKKAAVGKLGKAASDVDVKDSKRRRLLTEMREKQSVNDDTETTDYQATSDSKLNKEMESEEGKPISDTPTNSKTRKEVDHTEDDVIPATPVTSRKQSKSTVVTEEFQGDSGMLGGKRSRRAAACVSYKEPSIGKKLRRGDEYTSSLDQNIEIYKDDKKVKKLSIAGRKRNALGSLTNTSVPNTPNLFMDIPIKQEIGSVER